MTHILAAPRADDSVFHSPVRAVTAAPPPDARDLALDRFFAEYFRSRPVNATYSGVHDYDDRLPDWSPEGLATLRAEMAATRHALADAGLGVLGAGEMRDRDWTAIDGALADAFLEIQLAELESAHFQRGNPSLAIGEALFGVISLMTRDFAPGAQRVESATGRLRAFPLFFAGVQRTLATAALPEAWRERALRECQGGALLLARLGDWAEHEGVGDAARGALLRAGEVAAQALAGFRDFVAAMPASANGYSAGRSFIDLLVRRGHWCDRPADRFRHEAREALDAKTARLHEAVARAGAGSWTEVAERLAAEHPTADALFTALDDTWQAARLFAINHDLLTWPQAPLRFVPIPPWTRQAAPSLYYLFYRSPAPFDGLPVTEYAVPAPGDAADDAARAALLRAWNYGQIKLNHVVHHGGPGHHVQNWHAQHAPSRIGRVAAVDCASRIGMFAGGTMAEGWACYATRMMDEAGFLTPLEQAAEQHARVRQMVRAIVDVALHAGRMSFDEAVAFHVQHAFLTPSAARAEVVKCSMFPGTAMMYWLGERALLDLRAAERARRGAAFSLRAFHDAFLAHGSLPVPLIARLMAASSDGAEATG